jgi:probable DNA repair protein
LLPDHSESRDTHVLVLVPNNVSLELTSAEWVGHAAGDDAFRAPPMEVLSLWTGRLLETSQLLEGREVHPVPARFRLQALWEAAIADSDLEMDPDGPPRSPGDLAALAREAMEAERLLVHWSPHPRGALDGKGLELGHAFGRWRDGIRRSLQRRGWMTPHEQLLQLVERFERAAPFPVDLPETIELRGFPELTRLESRLLDALERQGVEVRQTGMDGPAPDDEPASVDLLPYASPDDEFRGAAAWAREQLEQGRGRVAVAVNGLAPRAELLDRIFLQTFHPEAALAGHVPVPSRYHVTAGPAALDQPLVRSALVLLECSVAGPKAPRSFESISRWLLSPSWAACDEEQAARARLELSLREAQRSTLTLAEVGERGRALACPELVSRIARLPNARQLRVNGSARRFLAWLEHWGWPGPLAAGPFAQRAVDALRGGLEALEFDGMDDDQRALSVLRRQLLDRQLRLSGGPLSPVQVLDVADLPGQRFDAVRVIDVHADNWPPPARLNRLLPVSLARELPRSSSRSQRDHTEALQRGVLATSARVSFSWPQLVDGVPTSPSPLVAGLLAPRPPKENAKTSPARSVEAVPGGLLAKRAWPHAGSEKALERDRVQAVPREPAPALGDDVRRLPRAVQVLNHQSACPWAAFLVHRLGVSFPSPPQAFPGPAELGSGVHDALEALYRPHLDRESRPGPAEVPAAVDQALRRRRRAGESSAGISALEAIERLRLEALLREWLNYEAALPWPRPQALEERREATFGGFDLQVRMDRLDAISGGTLILDYKTGVATAPAWAQERPTELQLPLYAVLMAEAGESPGVIGLLTVRRNAMKQTLWSGDASLKTGGMSAGVTVMGTGRAAFALWEDALAHWRRALTLLLDEYRQGACALVVHHPKALAYLGLELLLRSGDAPDEEAANHE